MADRRPPPRMVHPMLQNEGPRRTLKRPRGQPSDLSGSSFALHSPSPASAGPSRSVSHHHHHHHQPHNPARLHLSVRAPTVQPAPQIQSRPRAPSTRASSSMPSGRQTAVNRAMPIIDLTGSSPESSQEERRPAPRRVGSSATSRRGSRDVIDVDELPDPPPAHNNDDVQVLYQRNAPRGRFQGGGRHLPPPSPLQQLPRPVEPNWNRFQPRLHQEFPQDPIIGHGGRIQQGPPNPMPNRNLFGPGPAGGGIGGGPVAHIMSFFGLNRVGQGPNNRGYFDNMDIFQEDPLMAFQAPQMNYAQQAPGILRDPSPENAAALRNADYKAPSPAQEGYTRSPKADDVLVCVQCDQELGAESVNIGGDEVWAAKCGHCYCGYCARGFRAPTQGGKRPRAKTKYCLVGCKVNLATKTGMFKIHL